MGGDVFQFSVQEDTLKEEKKREAGREGEKRKERIVEPTTRRRKDKRRKGFKPRSRDKLVYPAGGSVF